MYELFYRVEINAVCLLLLVWIIYQSRINQDQQTKNILFRNVMISSLAVLVLETVQLFVNGRVGTVAYIANYALSFAYLAMNAVMAYNWFIYTLEFIIGKAKLKRVFTTAVFVPVVFFIILLTVSLFNGSIFYIERDTNLFKKGSFYFIQAIITYGFFTAAAFVALVTVIFKRNTPSKMIIAIAFLLMPLLGGLFHMLFPEAKIIWQLLAVSQMLVFCDDRFSLISIDALTGINNRRSFDNRMRMLSLETVYEKVPYLFMMDINLFKDINDSYGHPEGDLALVNTAKLLKEVFKTTDAYICRYGGDEFAVVYACENAEEVQERIHKVFEDYNKTSGKPYTLMLSVGYAKLNGTGKDAVVKMIKQADLSLYDEKRKAHALIARSKKKKN